MFVNNTEQQPSQSYGDVEGTHTSDDDDDVDSDPWEHIEEAAQEGEQGKEEEAKSTRKKLNKGKLNK